MTTDQILLFVLFSGILALLLWGRFRHDLVAAGGLLTGVVIGVVPQEAAFEGFSNPAVLIVALVLIASRAFENSGALEAVGKIVAKEERSVGAHISIFGGLGAVLSAVINNVAALAILMPIDVKTSREAGRAPGLTLMPLAFVTILGGMITLIGTPSNIIASSVRQDQLGAPYGMFDFTPVGAVVALAGIAFVALVGWRMVPARMDTTAALDPSSFVAHLRVQEGSEAEQKFGIELSAAAEEANVLLSGIVRDGKLLAATIDTTRLAAGDYLMVEGATEAIGAFMKALDLQRPESSTAEVFAHPVERASKMPVDESAEAKSGPEIIEAVVRSESPLVGRSAASARLRPDHGVTLLGISAAGRISSERINSRLIAAGDELLITGQAARSKRTLDRLGLVAINRVNVAVVKSASVALVGLTFIGAIGLAASGLLAFHIAIAIAVIIYAGFGLIPAREFYSQIEWPVVVMLACLLPLGTAFERVGGTALIANAIAEATQSYPPVVALIAIMVVTLTLSDVLNNVATMIITGPIAIDLANRLGVNADTFLMGVAISASCAFLTPIGHKNNTLIMGPGGFRFSDYWRMGLPLEIVILSVAVPMLLIVWPL